MNIFFLHIDIKKSVHAYFNKHCVKIILEICQMLYTAHWMTQDTSDWITFHYKELCLEPYKKTHHNHPTNKWVRKHKNNYIYTCAMGLELCYEYTRRYNKIHKSQVRLEWLIQNVPTTFDDAPIQGFLADTNIPTGCTPVPLAMPNEFHTKDAIYSYRLYYIKNKQDIAQTRDALLKLSQEWNIPV